MRTIPHVLGPRRIGATLVYYGLWINATDIAGNKYLNFILVSAVEIPAGLLNILVMEKLSRRMALSSMFISISVTCALYNMIPDGLYLIYYASVVSHASNVQ